MSATEQIYELLVQANPVPDPDALLNGPPVAASELRKLDPGRIPMQTQEKPKSIAATRPKRWIPAAAAAAAAVVVGGAALLFTGAGDESPPVADRESAAVDVAERFMAAVNAGDLGTIVELADPDEADLRMWEMNAVIASEYPNDVGACVAAITTDELVRVECDVTVTDPVFVALGAERLVFPWQVYADGRFEWRPFEGADPVAVNREYRDYLLLNDPDAYREACDPSQHALGSVNSAGGTAFTAECGQLRLDVAEDVAAWIEAGRPES